METEKDRWWLIGVSILWQQLLFICAYIFPHMLDTSGSPVAIIWVMSFILSWAYLGPVSGKKYLKCCAKIGWLYLLAAIVSNMSSFYFIAFGHGDLFGSRLRFH